tara:strand:- start:330 stop:728 length:399 start_codon:yes stop_codon:yes gene_type:complete
MSKNFDKIAAIEKAIKEKYGDAAVTNPNSEWTEEKEKEYIKQAKELYSKNKRNLEFADKIDVNGIKVSKKLLNRESLRSCPVCGAFPKKTMDDVCLVKFQCCNNCYIKFVEDREERWLSGWRPAKTKIREEK